MNTAQKWNGFGVDLAEPATVAAEQDLATIDEPRALLAQAPQIIMSAQNKGWLRAPTLATPIARTGPPKGGTPNRKTGRTYGEVWQYILGFARQQAQFSTCDLCPPLTQTRARKNCAAMAVAGLLVRVQQGQRGIGGQSAVYSLRHCSRCGQPSSKDICFDCLVQREREGNPDAKALLSLVSKTFAVGDAAILGESRLEHVAQARQVLAYCLHRLCGWNLSRIGRFIGRDHGTVSHAVQAITDRMELSEVLREKVLSIEVLAARATNFSRGTKAQTAAAAPLICTAPAAVVHPTE